jgi:transcriptional regulator with XRE-family HTH domain
MILELWYNVSRERLKLDEGGRDIMITDQRQKRIIGARLRTLREARGLTQAQLADAAGVSQQGISQAENPEEEGPGPTVSWLSKIARVLGTSIDYLSGDTNDSRPPRKIAAGDTTPEWDAVIEAVSSLQTVAQVEDVIAYVRFLQLRSQSQPGAEHTPPQEESGRVARQLELQ